MSDPQTLREMGRIVRPHGVTGEIKVAPETDDPDRFRQLKSILVGENSSSTKSFDILSVRLQPSKYGITVLLALSGVNDRQAAERLNKLKVYADENDLPPLEEGEFYYSDLIGLAVVTNEEADIGEVKDVIEGPGQDLLVIKRSSGAEVMIPLVEAFVVEIDFDQGKIILDPVEGLL